LRGERSEILPFRGANVFGFTSLMTPLKEWFRVRQEPHPPGRGRSPCVRLDTVAASWPPRPFTPPQKTIDQRRFPVGEAELISAPMQACGGWAINPYSPHENIRAGNSPAAFGHARRRSQARRGNHPDGSRATRGQDRCTDTTPGRKWKSHPPSVWLPGGKDSSGA